MSVTPGRVLGGGRGWLSRRLSLRRYRRVSIGGGICLRTTTSIRGGLHGLGGVVRQCDVHIAAIALGTIDTTVRAVAALVVSIRLSIFIAMVSILALAIPMTILVAVPFLEPVTCVLATVLFIPASAAAIAVANVLKINATAEGRETVAKGMLGVLPRYRPVVRGSFHSCIPEVDGRVRGRNRRDGRQIIARYTLIKS